MGAVEIEQIVAAFWHSRIDALELPVCSKCPTVVASRSLYSQKFPVLAPAVLLPLALAELIGAQISAFTAGTRVDHANGVMLTCFDATVDPCRAAQCQDAHDSSARFD